MRAPVVVFAAALFLSAFLLFSVEPLAAKMVLPALGGAPMVWNTCVVFFQLLLFAGYVYAYAATASLTARRHAIVYAVILAAPLVVLPFSTRVSPPPPLEAHPVAWLLDVLVKRIGLPFFALSTSAAVLQHWFSRTAHRSAEDPYFLYAASNAGSLVALVSYPAVVEPILGLHGQSRAWAVGYGAFVVAALLCAAFAWSTFRPARRSGDRTIDSATTTQAIPRSQRAMWVALSFVPSSLMLGVTSYLSTDIAAVPLLWIGPLALYLLTLAYAFGSTSQRAREIADRRLPLLLVPLVLFMVAQTQLPLWLILALHLLAFTASALICHVRLAQSRPPRDSLTEFYFWITLGGLLGGLFNTVVAPILFDDVVEYPLILVIACAFRTGSDSGGRRSWLRPRDAIVVLGIFAVTEAMRWAVHSLNMDLQVLVLTLAIPAVAAFSQSRQPVRFALCLGAMLLAAQLGPDAYGLTVHQERTFFGVYRVTEDDPHHYRSLFHGTTLHGMQSLDPARRREPLTYYHRTGPFGQAFARVPRLSTAPEIAVVGLGVGSLASYASEGQRWTFYELDPAVERLARTRFTYLSDCGDRCRVVLGDARASLAAADRAYGLIVLDAFSSDAIPVHLLTREAIDLYLSRLLPHGVLAFHISNRHLSLAPVLGRLAHSRGLTAVRCRDMVTADVETTGKRASEWLLMAAAAADLTPLTKDPEWTAPRGVESAPLWTDDASSILSVLRVR
jgi:hypothetical protein